VPEATVVEAKFAVPVTWSNPPPTFALVALVVLAMTNAPPLALRVDTLKPPVFEKVAVPLFDFVSVLTPVIVPLPPNV
jgi:hypothetical protein